MHLQLLNQILRLSIKTFVLKAERTGGNRRTTPAARLLSRRPTTPLATNLHQRAFTLTEVLVALVVVGILTTIAAIGVPGARTSAQRIQCASNMRQIGVALLSYATDNDGFLPQTRHSASHASNWIYTLAPYLDNVDAVRVCPADEPQRRSEILRLETTSYLLNDIIFDPDLLDPDAPRYDNVQWLPQPASTLFAVISNRPVSRSWDHAHCAEWVSWNAMLTDVAIDRHRRGARSANRLNGDANYLYADGRVENISARDWKSRYFDRGLNPGAVPR